MALPINIKDLLNENTIEWDRIELKKGWNPEAVLHTICAFANDINNLDGGYIIIGVTEHNGVAKLPPVGLERDQLDAIQKKLINLCYYIKPHYTPIFSPYVVDDRIILVIWSPIGDSRPYKVPVSINEKSPEKAWYIRRGSKTLKVKEGSDDARRLLELTARIPFDDRMNPHASLEDINLGLIQAFLRQVKSALYEDIAKIPFVELCRQMKIIKGPTEHLKPLNVGLMLFNENPKHFFDGARIELVVHKGTVGKNYSEKVFEGPVHHQIRNVLDFFRTNIIEEIVQKHSEKAEAVRFFNYPYQALEEAIVNAAYHKSYERPNPIEIHVLDDKIEILNFPGPMPPVDKEMLQTKKRIIAREYRNRKLGGYFKELKLTEGRGTGILIIYDSMESNGSPCPLFETDDDQNYFLCTLPIHPLVRVTDTEKDSLKGNISVVLDTKDTSKIGSYLSLSVSELGDHEIGVIKKQMDPRMIQILRLCLKAASKETIFEEIDLYRNTKNYTKYIKPLIEKGWLQHTLPDRLTSRYQQYITTDKGEKLLQFDCDDEMRTIQRTTLVSATIAYIVYHRARQILEIVFHTGLIEKYLNVPEEVHEALIIAPSHSAYYSHTIKGKYPEEF
jgi:ATP-dependent DNA helicase RecG